MKILHTSDLHLGRSLNEHEDLIEDQRYVLNEMLAIIENNKIDAFLISGDIYDKSIPTIDAINLFNDFLNSLHKLKVEVFIISGNHDSNDRLNYGANLFDMMNIHIESIYKGQIKKYSLKDVDIYLLPFIKPLHIKKYMADSEYKNINNANDMMKWVLNKEDINKKKKNILMMHQFVVAKGKDLELSDSEMADSVGTLEKIDAKLLKDFDYVALGHIHKPQKVTEKIIYSGSPLQYSFSECGNNNHVVLYDSELDSIEYIDLKPLRKMRIIKDTFENIMKMKKSDDLIKVELLDEEPIISPMDKIKKHFPNALALSFVKRKNNNKEIESVANKEYKENPLDAFSDLFEIKKGRKMNKEEKGYMEDIINKIYEDNK